MLSVPQSAQKISHTIEPYHRSRVRKHYSQTPHALICGYVHVSDGAKLTYQVLLTFDYVDKATGQHRGVVDPTIETLMKMRDKSRSTIYSHLTELQQAHLIEPLGGMGWRLYNVSEEEEEKYLSQYMPGSQKTAVDAVRVPKRGYDAEDAEVIHSDIGGPVQKSGRGYKRNLEEENIKPTQLQYYEARFDDVVTKLIVFGYTPGQAERDFVTYGRTELVQQLENLSIAVGQGTRAYAL
jgi:hypothetical protein